MFVVRLTRENAQMRPIFYMNIHANADWYNFKNYHILSHTANILKACTYLHSARHNLPTECILYYTTYISIRGSTLSGRLAFRPSKILTLLYKKKIIITKTTARWWRGRRWRRRRPTIEAKQNRRKKTHPSILFVLFLTLCVPLFWPSAPLWALATV